MIGDDFLRLARKMVVTHRAEPAALRTVVSRAYYAVFHAKLYLEQLGFAVPRTENAHLFVQVRLLHANQVEASEIGALLANLHERRKRADYDLADVSFETLEFAAEAVHRADRVRGKLDLCEQEPARTQVKDGIDAYHKSISPATPNA